MYADYYHLKAMPFQLTTDCQFLFESEEHRRAISHLIYGLAQEEGFIVITGEIGAGKTMLVERLWSQIDQQKFVAARILTTHVSGDDLLKMVAHGFGLVVQSNEKATLLRDLQRCFEEIQNSNKRCLLVVDEVQNLPTTALEELRMLSNFSIAGRAPFQCFLLGQPEFRNILSDPGLEQLKQRILASYHLGPMAQEETRKYVEHRLTTAGWSGDPTFEDAAFGAIHHHTDGIPRRINALCSRVLLAGFLDETHCITELMVNNVGQELLSDLTIGRPRVLEALVDGEASSNGRLDLFEQVVARHDHVIKRVLKMAIQIFEARR